MKQLNEYETTQCIWKITNIFREIMPQVTAVPLKKEERKKRSSLQLCEMGGHLCPHIKEEKGPVALQCSKRPILTSDSQQKQPPARRWISKSLEASPLKETPRIWTAWKRSRRSWSCRRADHPTWSGRSGSRGDLGPKLFPQTGRTPRDSSPPYLHLGKLRTLTWSWATSAASTRLMTLWSIWGKSWWGRERTWCAHSLHPLKISETHN